MKISIVTPFFNEEKSLNIFFKEVENALSDFRYEIICVDDGSNDKTLEGLLEHKDRNQSIKVVELSRNFGKEAALTAGLKAATGDAVVIIDADLQDPPEIIPEMIKKWWRNGRKVSMSCSPSEKLATQIRS